MADMIGFPKFPTGKTWREAKAERRLERQATERRGKDQAKRMDQGRCRWPHCDCRRVKQPLEGAHLEAKGMGGNPLGDRHDPRNIISLCHATHRGPKSLHSGDRRIVPLSEDGTRGPCEFWQTDDNGEFFLVAREREPFVYERD